MKKLPYSIEVNGSGEICSLFQEEQTLGLPSDWQLLQRTGKNQKDGEDTPRRNCGHSHSTNVLCRDIRVEAIIKTVK
jgi:hypothetical protein